MKVLWIHSGMPKNGSSAIQVFFAKNRLKLLEEDVNYLELSDLSAAEKGAITSGNAGFLSRTLLQEKHEAYYDDNSKSYRSLLEQITKSNNNKFIISSEFLSLIPLVTLKKLKDDLKTIDCKLRMIYYVRRQDQFLMSGYMQRVKRHNYIGYPDEFVINAYKNNDALNYYKTAKKFESILGQGNVKPFIYESTKKHKLGLIGHITENILGYLPSWIVLKDSINTSPSPLEVKLMLVANQYQPRMQFSDLLVQNSIQSGRSKEFLTHNILPSNLAEEILDYFEKQNQLFELEYTTGESFPRYENNTFVDLRTINISANEVLDILTGFLVKFDNRIRKLENKI